MRLLDSRYTHHCTRCSAHHMSHFELVQHSAIVHNVILRNAWHCAQTALALTAR